MNPEMLHLFATPVHKNSLGRDFSDAELQFFKQQLNDPVAAISNHSSRNKLVLDAPEMQAIRAILQENLNNYFDSVFNTSDPVTLEITQSWLTISRRGDSHHAHIHPNSIASGVLYINLARNDGINFYRNEDSIWYELMRKEDNYYNASKYLINTTVGDIIIFPSNVRHGVKEVVEDVERVSLSFNTFFSGELGREEFSNALRINLK